MRPKARLARAYAFASLVACSLTPAAASQTGQTENPAIVKTDLSRIEIDNFGRVNERYYRGAQPGDDDYEDLSAIGVKALINLTGDDAVRSEKSLVEKAGMKYFQIPMTTHETPTPAKVAEFLRIVNDPSSQPVYVHCIGGRHRTGVMTAIYRMTQDGWTADQAFREMKQYKFGADFLHPEFKRFVYSYHPDVVHTTSHP